MLGLLIFTFLCSAYFGVYFFNSALSSITRQEVREYSLLTITITIYALVVLYAAVKWT